MSVTQDLQPHALSDVQCGADDLSLAGPGVDLRFHNVWLRDNCWCAQCRVEQSGERRLFTADIPDDIRAVDADPVAGGVRVRWSDGHESTYALAWLLEHDYGSASAGGAERADVVLWTADLPALPRFEHDAVLGDPEVQAVYLDAVRRYGAAIVANTPGREGEVERFAQAVGHVRETAFERIHNVRFDPGGYNVAHTPIELKPHTDLPSYHWPPSVQLLHFLLNEATGGESTLVDGWAVLRDLRAADPEAFDLLCRVPVDYQLFSDDEDTRASSPMITLDAQGEVRTFRYSNQLALPIRAPFETMPAFYRAYRTLGRMIDGPTYKLAFKTRNGDLLTVHSHRVLHGRLPFDPTSGARHLQDVYMEFDDLMARRRVLAGDHRPTPSYAGAGR